MNTVINMNQYLVALLVGLLIYSNAKLMTAWPFIMKNKFIELSRPLYYWSAFAIALDFLIITIQIFLFYE